MLEALERAVKQTGFDADLLGAFSADELRTMYLRSSEPSELQSRAALSVAKPEVPYQLLTELTQQLRPLLSCYLDPDSDRVGSRLVRLKRERDSSEPTIADLAQALLKPAATLGSERVVELLLGWIDGEPLHFRSEALLSGATVGQPLALTEAGVRIDPLPESPADLAASLPPLSAGLYSDRSFYGAFRKGVRLSIDCRLGPVFYKPSKDETDRPDFRGTWIHGKIPAPPPFMFCEALSLACNHCIRWALWWHDYGGLEQLNAAVGPVMYHDDIPREMATIHLSEEHLKEMLKIYLMRHGSEAPRPQLDMVIARWMKSKGFLAQRGVLGLADQFIDLRIALEALYLGRQYGGEKGFRLATYGAWHLGADPTERSKYHKTLRGAYNRASDAVHSGEVKNTPEVREQLTTAQDLCREGILKRLFEDPEPEWDKLIMGEAEPLMGKS
ncbi:MAG: hypothetical protein OXH85_12890 [Truepera sp.]|nr:hypothetical protein [Truepera sp.]